jgi:hypothetical protein
MTPSPKPKSIIGKCLGPMIKPTIKPLTKPLVWSNMSLKDLIASMRKVATESDNIGKALEPQHYKRREYFDAANKLRDAAYALEYVIS